METSGQRHDLGWLKIVRSSHVVLTISTIGASASPVKINLCLESFHSLERSLALVPKWFCAGSLDLPSIVQPGSENVFDESIRLLRPPFCNFHRRREDMMVEGRSDPVLWMLISTSCLSTMALEIRARPRPSGLDTRSCTSRNPTYIQ